MSKSSLILLTVICLLSITGCEKYEAGGLISKTEQNLVKTWKLQQYLRNNTDETSSILISNYEETYQSNNSYPRSYTIKFQVSVALK